MSATVGDRVQVQRKSVQALARTGMVEAVLSESPGRYQVRWTMAGGASFRRQTARCASFHAASDRPAEPRR